MSRTAGSAYLVAMALCIGTARPAAAQDHPEVALLPMEATPGVDTVGTQVFNRGIAAAFQHDGRLRPVFDAELEVRITEGREDRLREARDALAEARRMLTTNDTEFAVVFLQEAVEAFRDAGSPVAHREEAADAYYALARAYHDMREPPLSETAMANALRLVPDYMATRADAVTPELVEMASRVTEVLAQQLPRRLSPSGASRLAAELRTPFLVESALEANGELFITLYAGSAALHIAERPAPFTPGRVGDPFYRDIADELLAVCFGEPIPTPTVLHATEPLGPPARAKKNSRWAVAALGTAVAVGTTGVVVAATWPRPPEAVPTWSLRVDP